MTSDPATRAPSYWMLCIALVCQLATVVLTWPVWEIRQVPANVPLLPLPAIPFGILVVASLIAAFVWPRPGVIAHAVVVGLACVWDQYRVQPQFLSLIVLMFACLSEPGRWLARWYLAAMWLWAGLHKFLSPEWFGSSSWWHLDQSGIAADTWHMPFAIAVAVAETALGIAAIVRPQAAAIPCAVMHVAIFLSLSPLVRDFNASVLPWNLATAIIGAWLLSGQPAAAPARWRLAVPAVLLLGPIAYYFNLVNPHLAFILYSGQMPRAWHTTSDSLRKLHGWGGLTVPFPDSPRMFARYFELTAAPGDKLYVQDPRAWVPDRYFILGAGGQAEAIPRDRFLNSGADRGEVRGIEMADPEICWQLSRTGVNIRELDDGVSCSAAASGPAPARELLGHLRSLPNVRELKLDDADLAAHSLDTLAELPRLEIIELRRCRLSESALSDIASAPELRYLLIESTAHTPAGLQHLSALKHLESLQLPSTQLDDAGLESLGKMPAVTWLDLSDNRVTDAGAQHLSQFPACQWINLSGTQITTQGVKHLLMLQSLQIIELSGTRVGDEALPLLHQLPALQHLDLEATPVTDAAIANLAAFKGLKRLNLRGTQMSRAGIYRLQDLLPDCAVDW